MNIELVAVIIPPVHASGEVLPSNLTLKDQTKFTVLMLNSTNAF